MFHNNLETANSFTKTLAAAALLLLPASATFAQGAYGVSVNTSVMGVTGSGFNNSGALSLDTFEYREMDPPPANSGWSDAGARGWATQGELRASTDATANHLGTYTSSYPYGFAEMRFWDTATVMSDTLPAGTPVTLIFRNDLAVTLTGTSLFAGTFYGTHTIAGRSSSLQQSFSYTDMDYTVEMPNIVVSTKVGARFTMSGRAYLNTRAYYSAPGPMYDGAVQGELVFKPILESTDADAYLVTDAGVTYTVGGN